MVTSADGPDYFLSNAKKPERESVRAFFSRRESTAENERKAIEGILEKAGLSRSTLPPLHELVPQLLKDSQCGSAVGAAYFALGGVLTAVPIPSRNSRWDIQTDVGIIEVDEERHFNRYRLRTLQSSLYHYIDSFPITVYESLCVERESYCPSFGQNWKNDSTEKQFGPSDAEGVFSEHGSSRWKQRAFYDMLKDATVLLTGVPVIRISVWDELPLSTGALTLQRAMRRRTRETDGAIMDLLGQRGVRVKT